MKTKVLHNILFKLSEILLLVSSIQLTSCCWTSDSKVAAGYPYGDWHELNHVIFHPCNTTNSFNKLLSESKIKFIKEKTICDSIVKMGDSLCDCNDIDFKKNILVFVRAYIAHQSSTAFYPRAILNHKQKKCIVEVRGWSKSCNGDEYGNSNKLREYNAALIIPRQAGNYELSIEYFYPAEESF